ncbi:MAG: CDP-alcohol phosphatidyltransferase family protein [Wenzhouxiangella sp.]
MPGLVLLAGLGLLGLFDAGLGALLAATALTMLTAAMVLHLAGRHGAAIGWASRVTLARAGLVAVLAAGLLEPALYKNHGWLVAGLALLALVLDGIDGWLARRLDECSAFGARFDMEVDAALILVLCLGVIAAGLAGPWVLLIGLMRYGFVAAACFLPWLGRPLPPSFRRKLVCVWQVSALLLALSPIVSPSMATGLLLAALAGLVLSFAIDVAWLQRHRPIPHLFPESS